MTEPQKPPSSLAPKVLQVVGLGGVISQLVFWMVTAAVTPPGYSNQAMLLAFGTLASAGLGLEALKGRQ